MTARARSRWSCPALSASRRAPDGGARAHRRVGAPQETGVPLTVDHEVGGGGDDALLRPRRERCCREKRRDARCAAQSPEDRTVEAKRALYFNPRELADHEKPTPLSVGDLDDGLTRALW